MNLLLIALTLYSLALAQEDGIEVPHKDLPQVPETPATARMETAKTYRFCGRKLAVTLALICRDGLDAMGIELKDNLVQSADWVGAENRAVGRRGVSVSMDCCNSVCTLADLMEYC